MRQSTSTPSEDDAGHEAPGAESILTINQLVEECYTTPYSREYTPDQVTLLRPVWDRMRLVSIEYLRNLGFEDLSITPAPDLAQDYDRQGHTDSYGSDEDSVLWIGRDPKGNPVLIKDTIVPTSDPREGLIWIKQLIDEAIAYKLANIVDPDYPTAKAAIIGERAALVVTPYYPNSQDLKGRPRRYRWDINRRMILSQLLQSGIDNSFQAIITKDGKYVPVDLTVDYEAHPTVEDMVQSAQPIKASHLTEVGFTKRGYTVTHSPFRKEAARQNMLQQAEFVAKLADPDYTEYLEAAFRPFPGSEEEKTAAITEIMRRAKLMPEFVERLFETL